MEENVGQVMIFTICEILREYLQKNNSIPTDDSEYQAMIRRAAKENAEDIELQLATMNVDEEEECDEKSRPLVGTPVTVETFALWKAAFDAEALDLDLHGTVLRVSSEKQSGRSLFQNGLILEGDNEEDDNEEDGEEDFDEDAEYEKFENEEKKKATDKENEDE